MRDAVKKYAPEDDLMLHYGITSKGVVLANLRFWPATITAVFLLVLAFTNVGSRASGMTFIVLWAVFTLLWIVWAMVMPLLTLHPGSAAILPSEVKAADATTGSRREKEKEQARESERSAQQSAEQQTRADESAELHATPAEPSQTPPSPAEKPHTASKPAVPARKKPTAPKASGPSKTPTAKKPPASRRHPAPAPQPFGVDHQGAEVLVAEWMRHLGVADATATRHVGDGGIDVDSKLFVAQVKHLSGAVGSPDLHRLAGVAAVAGKHGVFFTNTTYSAAAHAFAFDARIALFMYDAHAGTLHGVNTLGKAAVTAGNLKRAFDDAESSKGTAPRTPRA